jgi:hypothetical protein
LPKGHRFAGHLYGYLSRHHTVEESVARARYALLSPDEAELTPVISRDWHLARLYFGRQGGGKLSSSEKARQLKHEEYGHKEFLNTKDNRVPVASRREFVGRRRQIQTILRHFRIRKYAGVLIHGFGRQGKSSLASRIANRMPDHQVVVVDEHYTAEAILKAFGRFVNTKEVRNVVESSLDDVRTTPSHLSYVVKELLEGPCRDVGGHSTVRCPVLLVIDNFEDALDKPTSEDSLHCVKGELVDAIRSVIEAFAMSQTTSNLLITSRYRFMLSHDGQELSQKLLPLHLPPMEVYEGRKQAEAKEKYWDEERKGKEEASNPVRTERCIHAARGNPGLQDMLFSLSLKRALYL